MKPTYSCATCGAKAFPLKKKDGEPGRFLRTCEHEKAPIRADMKANCAGKGGLK